jgi:hypothetical protein
VVEAINRWCPRDHTASVCVCVCGGGGG